MRTRVIEQRPIQSLRPLHEQVGYQWRGEVVGATRFVAECCHAPEESDSGATLEIDAGGTLALPHG